METKKLEKSVQPVVITKLSWWSQYGVLTLVVILVFSSLFNLMLWESYRQELYKNEQEWMDASYFANLSGSYEQIAKQEARRLDKVLYRNKTLEQMVYDLSQSTPVDVFCLQESQDRCFPHLDLVGPIYNYTTGRWESCPILISHSIGVALTPLENACLAESLGGYRMEYFPLH